MTWLIYTVVASLMLTFSIGIIARTSDSGNNIVNNGDIQNMCNKYVPYDPNCDGNSGDSKISNVNSQDFSDMQDNLKEMCKKNKIKECADSNSDIANCLRACCYLSCW